MGAVLNFPGIEKNAAVFTPTVLTDDLVARMSRCNQVARTLRGMGYRVLDEDIWPDDDGSPIIQIDLAGVSSRPLQLLAQCQVSNLLASCERVTIEGVRVFWHRGS